MAKGAFFVMLGPSGCGKTTTLRMIAGLELPTPAASCSDGEDVTFLRAAERDIAFVFQLFALYPHMNVRKNIGFPLVPGCAARAEVRNRVREAARLLRIDHLLDRKVSGLSGGDRQRVALGRAIVRRPKAFLMDEPLGRSDAELREVMAGELRELHDRIGATTVYVTHDQLEAMSMADRIAVMNHGVVEQIGAAAGDLRSAGDHVRRRFRRLAADELHAVPRRAAAGRSVVRIDGAAIAVPEPREELSERDLVLGVRPEHVRFSDGADARSSFGTEYLGTTQIVTVADRAGPDQGAAAVASAGRQHRRDGGARRSEPNGCRVRGATGRAIRSAPDCAGEAPWLRCGLERVSQAIRRRSQAVRDLSLTIGDGEFVVLLGPTGAGKTTTLRLIAGLERPDPGAISIDGRDVTGAPRRARRRLRLPAIFALSASDGVTTIWLSLCAPRRADCREAEIEPTVQRGGRLLRIAGKLQNRATRLSGGEMQRVAIGRALVRRPAIYLMDEPLSSLDAKLRAELRLEIKRIQHDLGATILYVTHDQIEAMTMANRIGVIDEGRLVQIGTPREIYESPINSTSPPASAARASI